MNIALHKPVKYCEFHTIFALLTDGDKSEEKSAILHEPCFPETYFEVDLEALYFVHYVVVTEGKEINELGKYTVEFY